MLFQAPRAAPCIESRPCPIKLGREGLVVFHKTNYVCKLNCSSFLSFADGNQNSWGKFTNIFMTGAVDHDQKKRSNVIDMISKYAYLKSKLMNMVTKNFIRTEHISR